MIASFFGTPVDNDCREAEAFAATGVHLLEMNISCPNADDSGVASAVKPVALRMVWQCAQKVSIPIIGLGGIMTGEDAASFMCCGAQAVQVGRANFTDPFACPRIIDELNAYCDAQELVGTLRAN